MSVEKKAAHKEERLQSAATITRTEPNGNWTGKSEESKFWGGVEISQIPENSTGRKEEKKKKRKVIPKNWNIKLLGYAGQEKSEHREGLKKVSTKKRRRNPEIEGDNTLHTNLLGGSASVDKRGLWGRGGGEGSSEPIEGVIDKVLNYVRAEKRTGPRGGKLARTMKA